MGQVQIKELRRRLVGEFGEPKTYDEFMDYWLKENPEAKKIAFRPNVFYIGRIVNRVI